MICASVLDTQQFHDLVLTPEIYLYFILEVENIAKVFGNNILSCMILPIFVIFMTIPFYLR